MEAGGGAQDFPFAAGRGARIGLARGTKRPSRSLLGFEKVGSRQRWGWARPLIGGVAGRMGQGRIIVIGIPQMC